jgi:hypothetical protein
VFGAAPGEGAAVDAECAGGLSGVACAAERLEEGGVPQRLFAREGAGHVRCVFRDFLHCKPQDCAAARFALMARASICISVGNPAGERHGVRLDR